MSIKFIKGDLFDSKANALCHGVNCKGVMGAGVAGQIAKRHNNVKEAYLFKHKRTGWQLGTFQFVPIEGAAYSWIVNVATQNNYGYDGAQYVNYDAVRGGLDGVLRVCDENKWSLALPRIGCGLAGGDWGIVLGVLTELSAKYPGVDIYVYSL